MADDPFSERLERACDSARARLGAIEVDRATLDARLAELETLTDHELEAAVVEIALARAVSSGDERAIAWFEREYVSPLPAALARFALDAAALDEVKQRIREKLLVAAGGEPPRIAAYAGRGRLGGLVQVAATREALDWLRRHRREVPARDADHEPAGDPFDPGLVIDREQTRLAFRAAFESAVSELSSRERNLLRMHLLGQVTLEQLATMYGVHRATVVRWLAAARERVRDATERRLREALGVRADELESLLRLAQSRLDVSVGRVLASDDSHE